MEFELKMQAYLDFNEMMIFEKIFQAQKSLLNC